MSSKIILISKKNASKGLPILDSARIIYLSDDYVSFTKLRQSNPSIELLTHQFHKKLSEKQNSFLKFCHELTLEFNSYDWWGTQIASRNSASIPLLKYFIYLSCAKDILKEKNQNFVFILDLKPLALALADEARRQGREVELRWENDSAQRVVLFIKFLLKSLVYLRNFLILKIISSRFQMPEVNQNEGILIRSWMSQDSFDAEGQYRDRNFGPLVDWLHAKNQNVWILPLFFNLNRSISDQFKLMQKSGRQFLIPERFLSFYGSMKLIQRGFKQAFIRFPKLVWDGVDVTELVRDLHLKTSFYPELLERNGIDLLFQKLSERGWSFSKMIYSMENNVIEKTFILASKKYFSNAKIIGFQHTVWYHEQLGMFLGHEETSAHPLPDFIVTSGKKYLDILKEAGFPSEKLLSGPNLRFSNITSKTFSQDLERKNVLVLFTFDHIGVLELLDKLKHAIQEIPHGKLLLKAHPLTPIKFFEKFLGAIGLTTYEWVKGQVQNAISEADLVIIGGATVGVLETIALGKPLIRVQAQNNYYFEPLWSEYPVPVCETQEELKKEIVKAFSGSNLSHELTQIGERVAAEYFEPITEENQYTFLSVARNEYVGK